MPDSTYSIDIDVSRALAAQQKLIDKMEETAKAGSKISSAMEPFRESLTRTETGISNVGKALNSISSSTQLARMADSALKVNSAYDKIFESLVRLNSYVPKELFTRQLVQEATEANSKLMVMISTVNTLASQLRSLPKHSFDFSSIEDYRQKLNSLGNELSNLRALKVDINPLDFSKMESSLIAAINDTKQKLKDHVGSKDPYGLVSSFDKTFLEIVDKQAAFLQRLRTAMKPLPEFVTATGSISGRDIAESMGFGDAATNHLISNMERIDSEAKRLNQTLSTSYSGTSNTQKSLIAASDKSQISHTGIVADSDIRKSMWGTDNVAKAFDEIASASNRTKTSLDASYQKYKDVQTAANDAAKAQMSFNEGMMKLGSYSKSSSTSVDQTATAIKKVADSASTTESKLTGLGLVVKRVFEYGLVYRFQNMLLSLPDAIYSANAAMEKLQASYRGIFQNTSENEFKYAMDAADKYGKSIESVADSYKKFAVTAEYLGMSQKDVRNIFESITQAMTKVGGSSSDVQNAFRAVEQMLSKGTVSAEEFRRQFAQYIPGAMKMGADAVGKTTTEFMKMMKNGELVSTDFLPKFAKKLYDFSSGWEESANTIEASSERMKNAYTQALSGDLMQTGIKNGIENVTNFIKAFDTLFGKIGNLMKGNALMKQGVLSEKEFYSMDNDALGSWIKSYESNLDSDEKKLNDVLSKIESIKSKRQSNNPFSDRSMLNDDTKLLDDLQKQATKIGDTITLKPLIKEFQELAAVRESNSKIGIFDPSVEAQLAVVITKMREVSSFDGKVIQMAINVSTGSVQAAMDMVDKLFSKTKAAAVEKAKSDLNMAESALNQLKQGSAPSSPASGNGEVRGSVMNPNQQAPDVLRKIEEATHAVAQAQGDLNKKVQEAAIIEDKNPYGKNKRLTTGNTKVDQINGVKSDLEETLKVLEDQKKIFTKLYENQPEKMAENLDAYEKKVQNEKAYAEGRINQINKQGGGHKEESHAIAVDKLTNSIDNLLTKEFALAEQDPLGAAFASAEEKANGLLHRVQQLALDGGISVDDMTKKIEKFKDMAMNVSVDKELEKLFPWLKKDNEITSIWKMLTTEWKRTEAEFAKMNISGEEGIDMLLKMAAASKQAQEEAKLLAKANSAANFGDYFKNASALELTKNSPGGSNEKTAMKEMADFFITTSGQMRDSRIEMYKRISEQAKQSGQDEAKANAFVQSKMEEFEVQRLEALQKYGTAHEAFLARMAQNYETYKSAQTKARDNAVKMADQIKGMTDTFAEGVGQSIGDIIRNMANGTASIEDLWKGMLGRIADMVAKFVEETVTNKLKDVFKDIAGSIFGSSTAEENTSNVEANATYLQSSFTAANFTGAVFSGTIGGSGSSSNSVTDAVSQATGSNSNSSGINLDSNDITKLGKSIGKETGSGMGDYFSESSGMSMIVGDKNALADIFTDGIDSSALGINAWKSSNAGAISPSTMAGTYGSTGSSLLGTLGSYAGAGLGGAGLGAGVSAALGGNSMIGTIGGAVGGVIGMAVAGPIGGAIGGLIGGLAGLFDTQKKEEKKKIASGYNVAYSGGHALSYGVDFYNTGVEYSGPSDPAVTKKISDSFREAAENLSDFAEELGFAVDVLEGFSMPSMNITSDQLDSYIANGTNMMAFKGLMEAGLRGAFDAVAHDGEVYSDEYERLSTSLKTVKGGFEAYGYELKDVAQISQADIDALRVKNTEVANGTASAMTAMATAMGATSDQLAQITTESTHAAAALEVTDEQLSNILEAQYSSDVLDQVGGEDAFNSIMSNLTKNIFNTVEAYAENLDYYTEKAGTAISKLGDASVTVDNFWEKFDEAIKGGLSAEQFEAWGKASQWVNNINSVTDAMESWDVGMKKLNQNLDERIQTANGLDYQASLTKQLADAEWELYDARKANYDEAYISRLQEVQALELAATKRKHEEDYQKAIESAQGRIYTATDDKQGAIELAKLANAREYADYEKQFTHAPGVNDELFKMLEKAYAEEIAKMVKDIANALKDAIDSLNLDSREAKAAGNDNLSGAIEKLISNQKEYENAIKAGVDENTLARLIKVQNAELEQYWVNIDKNTAIVAKTLAQLKEDLLGTFNEFIDKQTTAIQSAMNKAQTDASAYRSAAESLNSTITDWSTSANPTKNAQQTFIGNQTTFNDLYEKAMKGDTAAFGKLSGAASSYKEAGLNYFGNASDYEAFYQGLVKKMREASEEASNLAKKNDNLVQIYQVQLDLYDLLKTELGKDDPNTNLIQAIGKTLGMTSEAIVNGNTSITDILYQVNQAGLGGYASIVDAISGSMDTPTTYLSSIDSRMTELNTLMHDFVVFTEKEHLQNKIDAMKSEYQQYYNAAITGFQNSSYGQYLQAEANTGYGANIDNILTTSYEYTNGQRWIDWAQANGYSPAQLQSWLTQYYGAGDGTVDWGSVMTEWLNQTGSLPGNTGTYMGNYQSAYEMYQKLLDEMLTRFGGYADGGISTGSQLAWVSEGAYAAEAHVPLPDGKTIPVTMSSDSDMASEIRSLRQEVANLRAEMKIADTQKIIYAKKSEAILRKWDSTAVPVTQEN